MRAKPIKPKFNKERCWKCKYRSYLGNAKSNRRFSSMTDLEKGNIACYYSVMTNNTCTINTHGVLTDGRGNEYDNCKYFEPSDNKDNKVSPFGKWVM